MNCVKDIIPVLIYKGVSKDNLRRIIRAVASDESRESSKLVNNKTASCNLTEIRQNSTLPHSHLHSDCSKAEDDLLHQEEIAQPKNSKHVITKPRPSKSLATRITSNTQSLSKLASPTTGNHKAESQEKSFCIVVTLKNNLKKQTEVKRDNFPYLNGNISRTNKSEFSLKELTKSPISRSKNILPLNSFMNANDINHESKSNELQEFGSYAMAKAKKSIKTTSAKKNLNMNCANLYTFDKQDYSKKESLEMIKQNNCLNNTKVKHSLPEPDEGTAETCILSPEEASEYRNYTCEQEPASFKKKPTKNHVKGLSDIDYIQKDIKDKNSELARLSEKDLRRSEKVMKHSKQLLNVENPVASVLHSHHSEPKTKVLKNAVIEQVSKKVKMSESIGNLTTFHSNRNSSVLKNKTTKTLYERLQSDKIFVNALSSIPKKPNGLKKSDSEPERKIQVPPLNYIYMDRLNENNTVVNSNIAKNHFVVDAKQFLQLSSSGTHDPYTSFGYTKKDYWSQENSTLNQMELNTDKHNTLRFPYKHFQRDNKKNNQSVPIKAEKNNRDVLNKILKTNKMKNKVEKKSVKINLKQISDRNKLLIKKTVKAKELPGYTPTDFFLGRTVLSKDLVDSTRMAKQFDKNVFVKYKIDLEPFNTNRELKSSQERRNMLHLSYQKKKESTDTVAESFSTQYRKIENDRAQQSKQIEYARGIY